jgi:hypothetical protein
MTDVALSGVLDVPADAYHADTLTDRPSLSASIAHVLVSRSPKHAWTAHPKLNPDYAPTDDAKFDVGTLVHSLLLDQSREVAVIPADDWRTKAAKEARDEARAAGLVPLLERQWTEVEAMVLAVREQFGQHTAQPPLLADGKPERTLVWDEDGVACRARLDWLRDDLTAIEDLKTTTRSADPDSFSRSLYGLGYDLKAAFYIRAVQAVAGVTPLFRWIVAETTAPYAVSVVSPAPALLEIANAKVDYALALWRKCVQTGEWPAYRQDVAYAEPPAWVEMQWLEREAREAA